MPLGRGIVEVFEAIPDRIEVSGHEPTWRVTGGSFDSAASYARDAFGDPVVVARQDRRRWWPRVTLTVTNDPELAAEAPPIELLADPPPSPETRQEPQHHSPSEPAEEPTDQPGESPLEAMFAYQEELRASAGGRVPEQRRRP